MKVLHFIDSLGTGGAEQLLVTLLPVLAAQGVKVGVIARRAPFDLLPELEARGIPVYQLTNRHRWSLAGTACDLAAWTMSENAQIVHAHLYFPAIATGLMRILALSPARSCVTFHNLAYAGANRPSLGLSLRRRLAVLVYPRGMDRCLAVSSAVAEHYKAALRLRRVDVVPNPVDVAALRLAAGAVAPSSAVGSACQIVLPGRIVHEKGHADLIEALGLLRARGIAPSLVVVGDGPLRAGIETLVSAHGLATQVRFTGRVHHAALLKIVAGADIVAVPSRYEGFGLAALEAMALGKPVVASQAGGLPETLGEAGLLVPPGSPSALAEAIGMLSQNPALRAKLGHAAATRAAEFDLSIVAMRLISIYEELLSLRA